MRLNARLAANLRALMTSKRKDLSTQQDIRNRAADLGYTMSQSTVQRILTQQVHTSLDIVEQLAEVYGIEPIKLLMQPDGSTEASDMAPSYDEKRLLLKWRKLSPSDQHSIMAYITVATDAKLSARPWCLARFSGAVGHVARAMASDADFGALISA